MSILTWQENDLAMTQEVIAPECFPVLTGRKTFWDIF